jgi:hypothetical protein
MSRAAEEEVQAFLDGSFLADRDRRAAGRPVDRASGGRAPMTAFRAIAVAALAASLGAAFPPAGRAADDVVRLYEETKDLSDARANLRAALARFPPPSREALTLPAEIAARLAARAAGPAGRLDGDFLASRGIFLFRNHADLALDLAAAGSIREADADRVVAAAARELRFLPENPFGFDRGAAARLAERIARRVGVGALR